MASFALISVEKEYKIDISEGKVTVGRGPFLQITDKRVSRNHATLEVTDGSFTVLPTHSNPTFYQACGETKFEPLEKDVAKILNNGDCISFLPNDLVFRVEKKENDASIVKDAPAEHEATGVSDTKDCNVEHSKVVENDSVKDDKLPDREDTSVEISERNESIVPDVSVKDNKSEVDDNVDEDDDESGDSDDEDDVDEDKTKFEKTAQLLNKTRVLPSWMTKHKGNDGQKVSKKGKTQEETSKKIVAEVNKDLVELSVKTKESFKENENETTAKNEHEGKVVDDNKENGDKEDISAETGEQEENVSSVVEEENKKRKRDEDDEQSNKREKKLPLCPYGVRCYRKNPAHFQEYSHDQASDEGEDESLDDLPECPYGEYCYRQNPRHRREYKHTPKPKTRERKAKKKAGIGKIRDDDEDGPNDYDFEDSFIDDDESESEHEPSDDSDWQPSGGDDDDDDDDDVKELLTEARNFTKNKKMLKPT